METRRKIAFYAPIKPPDHPIPSGDRQMARMLYRALERAGYDVQLASRFIAYSKRHDLSILNERRSAAKAEAERLLARWRDAGWRPQLWFCYHPYDKAPDWLGTELCPRLEIPMMTVEACKTGQGPRGEWDAWREEAQRGIALAARNLVMKPTDMEYLQNFVRGETLVEFPPFIDTELVRAVPARPDPWPVGSGVRLLAAAMMRPGAKLDSYQLLAQALQRIHASDWSLVIAGDGPCRTEITAMFDFAPAGKVNFVGEKSSGEILGLMGRAEIMTWPGCREAYGMTYLEAASQALPVVALETMGVPTVVRDNRTGLLARPPTVENFAMQLECLIGDPKLREVLGNGAAAFVEKERSAAAAAGRLRKVIEPLLAHRSAAQPG